ncbi:BMP family lipoprotein [Saccharothrix syringae]|uniref:BMP family ABC transporter substrate-binding protein n=1 Tax=Saccharothrix syringae TaxID=103733 RepID=A0A5Q0HAP0_SACSY|nr:BMP family ABC transporter substrate-binding protein [Saccharothrix syringae]QFZ23317.1 BMP family ABC transporter substrate-binding protein [Saccharothrix syringae]
MRGIAVAAIALTSVLSMAACAKDSGGNNTGSGQGNNAEGCKLADKPPAAAAGSSTASSGEKIDGSALKVGLAYDIGGRGDASFNDSAAAGLDKAKAEYGLKPENVKELTAAPNEPEDAKQTRLRQLASEGYNPIIGVGFAYAESLGVVAPEFPNVKFAIVDGAVEGAANVTPLVFAEQQGSFLAGVIAAYKSKSCHVGFVGGVEIPLIQKFDAGFEQGAKAAAPDIKIERKYLTPAGDFTGFQDPTKGQEAATGQIEAGADVLYHAAGASGKGVFSAAKAGNALAIGVDSDQYNQTTVAESKDVIVSSMLKRVDVAVFDFVGAVAKNDLASLPKVFDLSVDGVGYATSGGKIDADLQAVLEGYKAQIIKGEITVKDSL